MDVDAVIPFNPDSLRKKKQQLAEKAESHPNFDVDNAYGAGVKSNNEQNQSTPSQQTSLKICLLNDSYDATHKLKSFLTECGYQVSSYYVPDEAYKALLEHQFDLFLVNLTKSQDIEYRGNFIHSLRASLPQQNRLSILMLMIDLDHASQKYFLDLGVDDIILKNKTSDLGRTIKDSIERLTLDVGSAPHALTQAQVCFIGYADEPSQAAIIRRLQNIGVSIETSSNFGEIIRASEGGRYNVIIIDQSQQLNKYDYSSYINALRKAFIAKQVTVPIIVLTQDISTYNITKLSGAGATHVLPRQEYAKLESAIASLELEDTFKEPDLSAPLSQPEDEMDIDQQLDSLNIPNDDFSSLQSLLSEPEERTAFHKDADLGADKATPSMRTKKVPRKRSGGIADSPNLFANMDQNSMFDEVDLSATPKLSSKKPRPKKIAVVGMLAVIIAVGAGIFAIGGGGRVSVDVTKVLSDTISATVPAPGRIVGSQRVELTGLVEGQIRKLDIKEGEQVKKGDVLAIFDDRLAQSELEKAKVQLENARQKIKLETRSLESLRQASKEDRVSDMLVEDLKLSIGVSNAELRTAKQALSQAKTVVGQHLIVAPFDGEIVQKYVEVGEWVQHSSPVLLLESSGHLEVIIYLDPSDASHVGVGDTVHMTSDEYPAMMWEGNIISAPVKQPSESSTELIVKASLGFDAPPLELEHTVKTKIEIETHESTAVLPKELVVNQDNKHYVAVIKDNRIHFMPVRIGITSESNVEIASGLKPGQEVIIPIPDMREGQKVLARRTNTD